MIELKEGDTVWVKINNEDGGYQGVVKSRTIEPDSYWVKVGDRIVRRNRKHLREISKQVVNRDNESSIDEREAIEIGSKIELRSRKARTIKPRVDNDYIYY